MNVSLNTALSAAAITATSLAISSVSNASVILPASYAYNISIDNQASAETDPPTRLNDDAIGAGSWNGGDYVGFGDEGLNAWASITFTFDDVYDFETITLYTYTSFNAGYIEVSTSTDNLSFSGPTQYVLTNTAAGGTSTAVTDTLDVTSLASAQYVKIEYFKTPTYPGAGNWVFPSEVDFSAVVPEPASLALLSMGSLLIARRGKRQG